MKHLLTAILLLAGSTLCMAQNTQAGDPSEDEGKGDIGIGLGMDYGGLGGRFAVRPAPPVALFAGLGYNLAGFGYNVGASWRISPGSRTVPYFSAMYGYNAVVVILDQSSLSKTYYGPTVGFGLEFHARRNPANYFNLEILMPFRDSAYEGYLNNLKFLGYQFSEAWPVGISLGYHWGY